MPDPIQALSTEELTALKQRLSDLRHTAMLAEISDPQYHISGRREEHRRRIASLESYIEQVEAEAA